MTMRDLPRQPRLLLLALAALAAAPLLPARADAQRRSERDYQSWIDTTFAFERDGVVQLDQIAGEIIVTTWDRPEARVRAYAEHADLDARLSRSRITVRLELEGGWGRGGRSRIGESRYELTLPVGARVKVASVSGDISLDGLRSENEVASTSGDVTLRDLAGLTTISTVSGDVQVIGVDGDVSANSVSGDLVLQRIDGSVRTNTVSGEITLRDVRSRSVTAKTTSGEVVFEGLLDRSGRYEFVSHSGDVALLLPSDVGAELTVETYSGSLDTDFDVVMGPASRRGSRPRSFELTLGSGGARVVAQSFSGDIMLKRGGGARRD